jgi:hypothetical protein
MRITIVRCRRSARRPAHARLPANVPEERQGRRHRGRASNDADQARIAPLQLASVLHNAIAASAAANADVIGSRRGHELRVR